MAVATNPGAGGNSIETAQRVGSDHRQVMEIGELPTFYALSPSLTATANRFHLVVYNNNASAIVWIRKVVFIPNNSAAVTTPVFSSTWTQRLRIGPTTDPTGTGGITIVSADSADTLPASITAFSNPGTPQAGGTTKDVLPFLPQPSNLKLATLDAPTQISGFDWAGLTIYDYSKLGPFAKPLTLRQDQCYEVQQGATVGTMSNYLIMCAFTVH